LVEVVGRAHPTAAAESKRKRKRKIRIRKRIKSRRKIKSRIGGLKSSKASGGGPEALRFLCWL
jgi:hypothetical protein